DTILISGDVFDLANPSSEARQQYYRSLMRLGRLGCSLIITGGNHDSPAMLNAPAEILKELNMHVIGGMPENLEDLIIPLENKNKEVECVIAAIPYLREAYLRQANEGQTYEGRLEAIQTGIEQYFSQAAEFCKTKFSGIPAIAMGHLFATGAITSESEREIQIGNQAAFNALRFGGFFNYIALGHIHKPQQVNATNPTFYSGSPLPLSFSERNDEKRVLLLDTTETWNPKSLPIPVFRGLLKISGNLQELKNKLNSLGKPNELDSLIEVELREKQYDATKILGLDELVSTFHKPGFEIVKHRATFENQIQGTAELYKGGEQLENLNPREVFLELLSAHQYDENIENELQYAFDELLEEIYSEGNN
ncbi:MAG TPA: exonuclease subunit SbcD, partial [Flavobacteriaceae bacterium]|nr:exonuclease subunit SbcD [Flavobacteriaceae bacterium]